MEKAIQRIVDSYVQLKNRAALEDLRMHRERLAIDLKGRSAYDLTLPIGQIESEIAVINEGLHRLND